MMKKTLLIVLVGLFGLQGFGQDPDLFRTWYVTDYYYNIGDHQEILDINPPIQPTLTITENLEFSGIGACNSFTGIFSFNEDSLIVDIFSPTLVICEHAEHIDFEQRFFHYFDIGTSLFVDIYEDGPSEQLLTIYGNLSDIMNFSSQPLSTLDFNLVNIKLYPNPVSDRLFISSENAVIERFTVYSLTGKKVLDIVTESNSIDVSSLSKGIYFIELSSSEGKSVKKFIKK